MLNVLLKQKSKITLIAILLAGFTLNAQVNFLSNFTGDQGGGTPLFNRCMSSGANDMFVNWEVFVDGTDCGGTSSSGAGQGSSCKVVLRGMTSTCSNAAVASDVVCEVPGIYNGENGSNDVYFANLNTCNLPNGRYSIEIHCDCMGGDYDNATAPATAATSWDYAAESVGGSSNNDGDVITDANPVDSPTYYYGDAAGNCSLTDGLDEFSINGDGTGGWREMDDICGGCVSPQLEYITIGDADVYRTMLVVNGLFLDMGKFQPGNPPLPDCLGDIATLYNVACVGAVPSFEPSGFCADTDALMLNGAETNITKCDCGDGFGVGNDADVTGNRLCYRYYMVGTAAPAFICENIGFMDDCPVGGPEGNTFPIGGSCENRAADGVLDQRWQTTVLGVNLLQDAGGNDLPPGNYILEVYTETDVVNCDGSAATVRDPATAPTDFYDTCYEVVTPNGTTCTPVELVSFEANYSELKDAVDLRWITASELNNSHFEVEHSLDAKTWTSIGKVVGNGTTIERKQYIFTDKNYLNGTNYYRLGQVDFDGTIEYSAIRNVIISEDKKWDFFPNPINDKLTIQTTIEGEFLISVYDSKGSVVKSTIANTIEGSAIELDLVEFTSGLYFINVHTADGKGLISKQIVKQ